MQSGISVQDFYKLHAMIVILRKKITVRVDKTAFYAKRLFSTPNYSILDRRGNVRRDSAPGILIMLWRWCREE